MATMQVELVAPERSVWSGEAEMVIARTVDGEMGVLAGHIPLMGALMESPVIIQQEGGEELVAAVQGGFLTVTPDGVTILAETVELADEIDVSAARSDLEGSRNASADDEEAQAKARWAVARLRAAGQDASL